jgi:hypothetical protein
MPRHPISKEKRDKLNEAFAPNVVECRKGSVYGLPRCDGPEWIGKAASEQAG